MAVHTFNVAELEARPWKNGAGVTREIVCQPAGAGMETFDWRVSIAQIAGDGPFSRFEGVDRVITLLDGAGVCLTNADGRIEHRMDTPLVPFSFAGEASINARLIAGECHDFNVMTRRAACRAEVKVLSASATLSGAACGLLLALRGTWLACDADQTGQPLLPQQGLWWSAAPIAWQLRSQDPDAALLAVLIHPVTA